MGNLQSRVIIIVGVPLPTPSTARYESMSSIEVDTPPAPRIVYGYGAYIVTITEKEREQHIEEHDMYGIVIGEADTRCTLNEYDPMYIFSHKSSDVNGSQIDCRRGICRHATPKTPDYDPAEVLTCRVLAPGAVGCGPSRIAMSKTVTSTTVVTRTATITQPSRTTETVVHPQAWAPRSSCSLEEFNILCIFAHWLFKFPLFAYPHLLLNRVLLKDRLTEITPPGLSFQEGGVPLIRGDTAWALLLTFRKSLLNWFDLVMSDHAVPEFFKFLLWCAVMMIASWTIGLFVIGWLPVIRTLTSLAADRWRISRITDQSKPGDPIVNEAEREILQEATDVVKTQPQGISEKLESASYLLQGTTEESPLDMEAWEVVIGVDVE